MAALIHLQDGADSALTQAPSRDSSANAVAPPTPIMDDVRYKVSLWDEAYDSVKREKSDMLEMYEQLLSRVLTGDGKATSNQPLETNDRNEVPNRIPQHDVVARRKKLDNITRLGLQHMENSKIKATLLGHEIAIQDAVATAATAVKWGQDYVKDAVKDLPYASLITAGLALVLPILTNPPAVEIANRDGFTYVTSQMRYYVGMEPLLFPEEMKEDQHSDVTIDLKDRLVSLYKCIIDFQVQSILRFYRERTKNYFRDTINHDKWDAKVKSIEDLSTKLVEKLKLAVSARQLKRLAELAKDAQTSREALEDLVTQQQQHIQVSRDQLSVLERIDQHLSNPEGQACLRDLRLTDPRDDNTRIEHSKGGLNPDVYRWVLKNDEFSQWRFGDSDRLLWIKGDPGKGKTMLLCGIIHELQKSAECSSNLVFFFCQATDARNRSATNVLRGLIYLLVEQQPEFVPYVRQPYKRAGKQLFEDVNAWEALCKIFVNILSDQRLRTTFIIVDALDECDQSGRSKLVRFFSARAPEYHKVKWIISSRNWPTIESDLGRAARAKLSLELNERYVSAAVQAFIKDRVDDLASHGKYSEELRNAVEQYLTVNANNTFLWVALVCQELESVGRRYVRERLTPERLPAGLDAFYTRMIANLESSDDPELYRSVLRVVSVVLRPITLDELPLLVKELKHISDEGELREIVDFCGSFLTCPNRTVSIVHQTAQDFLQDGAHGIMSPQIRSATHLAIFSHCLEALSSILRRDIYDLRLPGTLVNEVETPQPDPLAAVRYACQYWGQHLFASGDALVTGEYFSRYGLIDTFLREKFLNWLESTSLLKCSSDAVLCMLLLDQVSRGLPQNLLIIDRIRDAYRFVRHNKTTIEISPLQVYVSALVFSPSQSITRQCYSQEEPKWIIKKPKVDSDWNACLQTLEGHSTLVYQVVWLDSNRLASLSYNEIRLWDTRDARTIDCHDLLGVEEMFASSLSKDRKVAYVSNRTKNEKRVSGPQAAGANITVYDPEENKYFEIHDSGASVKSLTWLPDGKSLASISGDWTLKIWDMATKSCRNTLEKDVIQEIVPGTSLRHSLTGIAFSSDATRLALFASRTAIVIYSLSNARAHSVLQAQVEDSTALAWSSDGDRIASSFTDTIVKIWSSTSSQSLATLEHQHQIELLAWSGDSSRLASGEIKGYIRVWHALSGQCLAVLYGSIDPVISLAWSPDHKLLASGSIDRSVRIWEMSEQDIGVPSTLELTESAHASRNAHEGDTAAEPNRGVFISPNTQQLAILYLKRIRIWNETERAFQTDFTHGVHATTTLSWSYDSRYVAYFNSNLRRYGKAGDEIVVGNISTGQIVSVPQDYHVLAVIWPLGDAGTKFAVIDDFGALHVHDASTGAGILTLPIDKVRVDMNDSHLLHTFHSTFDIRGCGLHTPPSRLSRIFPSRPVSIRFRNEQHQSKWSVSNASRIISSPEGENWITYKGKRIVWVPNDFRPDAWDAFERSIIIAYHEGPRMILQFSMSIPGIDT